MKIITVTSCCLKKTIILVIFLSVIFGGDKAYSKNVYIVTAQKPKSQTTTQFYVYANNELEAAENVTLNGWKVLDIKKSGGQVETKEDNISETNQEVKQDEANKPTEPTDNDTSVDSESSLNKGTKIEKTSDLKNEFTSKNEPAPNDNYSSDNYSANSYVMSLESNILPQEKVLRKVDPVKLRYFGAVYFDLGKSEKNFTEEEIKRFKSIDNESNIIVYGHTDSVPVSQRNEEFKTNYELSLKRAMFVKKAIVKYSGLSADNVKIAGFGALFPKEDNTVEGQPLNRRVEIYEY